MKFTELKDGDILEADYGWLGRPAVYYVVVGNVAVSFKGDVNGGDRPMGWYQKEGGLPMETTAVYRAKHVTNTFNGDFDNEEIYDCLWRKGEKHE